MSMTGKDYQAIAARFRNLRVSIHGRSGTREQVQAYLCALEDAAHELAAYACKNPRFDRQKFLEACKPEN